MKTPEECPCGSGAPQSRCCEPYLNGTATAPTAEALMRSRYTASFMGNESYLLQTWHSSTRPTRIDLDPRIKWLRLKIIHYEQDRVEFIATFKSRGKAEKLHENSRFVYEHGKWFYVNGDIE